LGEKEGDPEKGKSRRKEQHLGGMGGVLVFPQRKEHEGE